MGLLGSMIAGGAKKVADGRVADIEKQEAFSLQKALLDAQMDKTLRLEEFGYQRDKTREATEAKEVKAITDTVQDPMADKGGYEEEGAKVKREYGLVEQKVSKLREAGKNDAADRLQKDLDRIDTKNNKEAILELKTLVADNNFKNQAGLLDLKTQSLEQTGKIAEAKNETALAKMEAVSAKGNKANEAQTRRADFIEAYANNPQYVQNGKLTGAGYDKLNKLNDDTNMQNVTEADVLDFEGKPMLDENNQPIKAKKVTRKEPVQAPKSKGGLVKDKSGNYVYKRL